MYDLQALNYITYDNNLTQGKIRNIYQTIYSAIKYNANQDITNTLNAPTKDILLTLSF